jgi:PAS domain S-box-containing protein
MPERIAASKYRGRQEWVWWLLAVLLVGAVFLAGRWRDHERLAEAERSHLLDLTVAAEAELSRQMTAGFQALASLRANLPQWREDERLTAATRHMTALVAAMPGVRSMSWLNAQGVVLASTAPQAVGVSLQDRPYFQALRNSADLSVVHLSSPFRTLQGAYALNLSRMLAAADRRFDGVVTLTLDPAFFRDVLRPTLHAPDMWAAIVHGDGRALLFEPPVEAMESLDLAVPGSLFLRHRVAAGPVSLFTGALPYGPGDQGLRLIAMRTLEPEAVPLDKPLVLVLTRSLQAIDASWWHETTLLSVGLALLAGGSALALHLLQRRQMAFAAQVQARSEQSRREAERLDLALRGADLALWDLDVASGGATVGERWFQMLGEVPQSLVVDVEGWRSRIHPDDWQAALAAQQAHIDGRSDRYEALYRMRHTDGRWVWVLDRGKVFERDAGGAAVRMLGTHMDISARVEAENALRASEQSLAITLHSIGDAVIATDARGRVTRINAAAARLTGWPESEAIGQPLAAVFRIFSATTREPAADPVQQVLERGEIVGLANDTMLVARDGRELQIADSAAPIRPPTGPVEGVVLVFSDVTEAYRVQRDLRERERQLAGLTDAWPGPVSQVDRDGRYRFANKAYETWFGTRPQDLVGHTQRELLGTRYDAIEPHLRRVQAGEMVRYETAVPMPDGSSVHALVTVVPDRNPDGTVCGHFTSMVDISDRKHAEDALRQSEQKMRALFLALRSGVVVHAADTQVLDANPAASELLGLSLDQMLGKVAPDPDWAFLQEDGRPLALEGYPVNQVIASGQPLSNFIGGIRRPGHIDIAWVLCNALPAFDAKGRLEQVVVTFADITERKRAEERLRVAQNELEATLAATPDLMFVIARDGMLLGYHSPHNELLFVPPERFIGRTVGEVMPADVAAVVMQALAEADAAGFASGAQYDLMLPGGLRRFELSVARKQVPAGAMARFVVLARDISDRHQAELARRALEAQLRESQKMQAIGTLAGGIAHDFNNIVAGILGNAALVRQDLPAQHPALASLEQIQRAGLRARNLVRQILSFSRREAPRRVVLPLRPVVEESLALLRATAPAGVAIAERLTEEPLLVEADPTQIQQVLMNLCMNAWQALPVGGGRVEVGLDREPGIAHLWVGDSGSGMDAATLERIFDPFFTTKPAGSGTGLGLAVVHGIMLAHQGRIEVRSSPGEGSVFHLRLPLSAAAPAQPGASIRGAAASPGTGQHVLYVDDDEIMRQVARRLLEGAGFRVTTCARAEDALATLQPGHGVDLLVSDLNMPGVSGLELCRQVAAAWPGLPLIISSGYVSDDLRVQAAALGVRQVLMKENTVEELVAAVAATV